MTKRGRHSERSPAKGGQALLRRAGKNPTQCKPPTVILSEAKNPIHSNDNLFFEWHGILRAEAFRMTEWGRHSE